MAESSERHCSGRNPLPQRRVAPEPPPNPPAHRHHALAGRLIAQEADAVMLKSITGHQGTLSGNATPRSQFPFTATNAIQRCSRTFALHRHAHLHRIRAQEVHTVMVGRGPSSWARVLGTQLFLSQSTSMATKRTRAASSSRIPSSTCPHRPTQSTKSPCNKGVRTAARRSATRPQCNTPGRSLLLRRRHASRALRSPAVHRQAA